MTEVSGRAPEERTSSDPAKDRACDGQLRPVTDGRSNGTWTVTIELDSEALVGPTVPSERGDRLPEEEEGDVRRR